MTSLVHALYTPFNSPTPYTFLTRCSSCCILFRAELYGKKTHTIFIFSTKSIRSIKNTWRDLEGMSAAPQCFILKLFCHTFYLDKKITAIGQCTLPYCDSDNIMINCPALIPCYLSFFNFYYLVLPKIM